MPLHWSKLASASFGQLRATFEFDENLHKGGYDFSPVCLVICQEDYRGTTGPITMKLDERINKDQGRTHWVFEQLQILIGTQIIFPFANIAG